jgi:hypothetical protein
MNRQQDIAVSRWGLRWSYEQHRISHQQVLKPLIGGSDHEVNGHHTNMDLVLTSRVNVSNLASDQLYRWEAR